VDVCVYICVFMYVYMYIYLYIYVYIYVGIASFGKLPQFIFQHMRHMTINCTEDAPVCLYPKNGYENSKEKQMKVAFVIHGLGGNRSLYRYSHIV
jgi:hypothetical protein